jgi:hypothetical protein
MPVLQGSVTFRAAATATAASYSISFSHVYCFDDSRGTYCSIATLLEYSHASLIRQWLRTRHDASSAVDDTSSAGKVLKLQVFCCSHDIVRTYSAS